MTPLALYQGPVPMRSRALTVVVLRYACQVTPPRPTAVARRWQRASAPGSPPRLAVVLVSLLTKKLIALPDAPALPPPVPGAPASARPAPPPAPVVGPTPPAPLRSAPAST